MITRDDLAVITEVLANTFEQDGPTVAIAIRAALPSERIDAVLESKVVDLLAILTIKDVIDFIALVTK